MKSKKERIYVYRDLLDSLDGKESTCNARDPVSIPESRRSLGEENGQPLQYYCLENSMDRGAQLWSMGVTESWT